MRDLTALNPYRDRDCERRFFGYSGPKTDRIAGYFLIPSRIARRELKVIASSGEIAGSEGWDHVSVSLPNRCPNWPEMAEIKALFFLPEEEAFQLHPAEAENISNHPHCLHIWRPTLQAIPLPPAILVGIKDLGELDLRRSG